MITQGVPGVLGDPPPDTQGLQDRPLETLLVRAYYATRYGWPKYRVF